MTARTRADSLAGKPLAAAILAALIGWATDTVAHDALGGAAAGAVFGFYLPELWLADMAKSRNLRILKGLPFFLDIVTMAVEAGLNLSSALIRVDTAANVT